MKLNLMNKRPITPEEKLLRLRDSKVYDDLLSLDEPRLKSIFVRNIDWIEGETNKLLREKDIKAVKQIMASELIFKYTDDELRNMIKEEME